jgi:hypothetical protein
MTMLRRVLPILAAICVLSSPGSAQRPSLLHPGARVQVLLPEAEYQTWSARGHFLRGRLESIGSDSLYLKITDSLPAVAVPHALIRRLYVSRGVPTRLGSGLRLGLVWGALSAVSTVLLAELSSSDGRSTSEALAVGGAIGLGSGLLFGALYPVERWERVRLNYLPERPTDQGIRLGVSFAW